MHTTQPATEATTAAAISYALNRHVPDMVRGFTIRTNYSDLAIQPGPLAARITFGSVARKAKIFTTRNAPKPRARARRSHRSTVGSF